MFNYIRSDQKINKTPSKKPVTSNPPMTPIEMEVNMPIQMQPIPQPSTNATCMYPHMDMPCMPYNMGQNMNMYGQDPYCDMWKAHDDMEVAYIKKMYPPLCQKIQKCIERELNQYDHDLSPIYEMYPSVETIDHMANGIYTNMKADLSSLIKEFEGTPNTRSPIGGSFYTLVYVMLLNELYRKRTRRRLYR